MYATDGRLYPNRMANRELFEAFERGVGRIIRAHRARLGWSQQELAERMIAGGFAGIIQTTVAKVEAGTRALRLAEFVGFAHALGMPWQALLAQQEPLLDERDPLADLERRVGAAQALEDDALEQLREGIESMAALYAERRAERTALAREYAELRGDEDGVGVVVDRQTKLRGIEAQSDEFWRDRAPADVSDIVQRDAASAAEER